MIPAKLRIGYYDQAGEVGFVASMQPLPLSAALDERRLKVIFDANGHVISTGQVGLCSM